MPIKAIATQADLLELQDALNLLAENLKSHADSSLSKAHGVQLRDGYGSTLNYQDSNGDVVADKFLEFCVDGVLYYAPAQTIVLDGQGSTVQAIADAASASVGTLGGTSLITNYASLETLQAQNVVSLFLEHTRLSHAQAHQGLVAIQKDTVDSAGHIVGHYVVQMRIGGIVYEFPCDTRFGGPAQLARCALNYTYENTGGENDLANPTDHVITSRGAWKPGVTYAAGDRVSVYDVGVSVAAVYVALNSSLNSKPPSADWDVSVGNANGAGPFTVNWFVAQTRNGYVYEPMTGASGTLTKVNYVLQGAYGMRTTYSLDDNPGRFKVRATITNSGGVLTLDCVNDVYARNG